MVYFILLIAMIFSLLLYFKIANRLNIIDKPNERSSHSHVTIRGGGIVFILAALIALVWCFHEFWLLAVGILIIGTISFLDDMYTLPNRIRIVFHIIAVTLMFLSFSLFDHLPIYIIIGLYVLVIGIINAYNFMDGINGITGLYSLVILGGLQYVNLYKTSFINPDIIWLPMIACTAFLVFNFRKRAKCFAGDVGSVTIAFWIIALLLDLIYRTGQWGYLLFLAVYGVDTILTIVHRLFLKQNIFKAHRMHFYQFMANERKMHHLLIAALYAFVQGVIIYCVIVFNNQQALPWNLLAAVLLPLVALYIIVKPQLMRPTKKVE
jgi:UDP-N-acetylmuramyl pentapeptide phosphotransferase/UDP-N-acetylglucosamine-1-phosphate transferase